MRYRFRSAFTLVELLVVVSIIALLISILLPSLSRARDTARMVKCQSVQKQIGTAFSMYTNEFPSWRVPDTMPSDHENAHGDGAVRWWANPHFQQTLNQSSGRVPAWVKRAFPFTNGMVCPDAWVNDDQHTHGNWPERRRPHGMGHNSRGFDAGWGDRQNEIRAHWMEDVEMPSEKLEFVDSTHVHVSPWKDTQYAQYGEQPPWQTDHHILAWRHLYDGDSGFGNVLFFDGHSESLSRGELTANPKWKLWRPRQ
jgi:prepilin-type N-terminal cleavage/methylation domain-containing protein/prepilin-type processing-associated H-X9-DG protein